MSQAAVRSAFQRRYDALCSRMRRVQLARAACWCLLALTAGVAALAGADYVFELPWDARAVGLAAWGAAVLAGFGVWAAVLVRRWDRQGTAVEIERRFPDLGQSLRTTVQFGSRSEESLRADGIAPALLAALEIETDALTQALSVQEIIPVGRLQRAAAAMLLGVLAMLIGTAVDWQWRLATQRALLARLPYTQMEVAPGDATVRVGESLPVAVTLHGRTDRPVILYTRTLGKADAGWTEHDVTAADTVPAAPRTAEFVAALDRIREPLEYRVTAGDLHSGVHRVAVRFPLRVADLQITLEPPAYTRLPASTVNDGNLSAIEGTQARFRIELDRPPAHASIHVTPYSRDPKGRPEPQAMPVQVDGAVISMKMPLVADATWQLDARDEDGTRLSETKYRIRIRKDQPPQVWFEEPQDPISVHALAEIVMRARARDDIGLKRAAIVFQINSEDEHELAFADFAEAAEELRTTGRLSVSTQTALEGKLPLELFELTQKDSVTYWAYAEDNYPDGPHRTLTDLRFLDIRPFKLIYRVPDPMDGMGAGGPRVATLNELITRQRFALNRTLRMARQPDAAAPDLSALDRMIAFQSELAGMTRQLAVFFENRANDAAELIYAAEAAMLAAVDSLTVGKFEQASDQQRDALRYLIEGRNAVIILLMQANGTELQNALNRFNREMMTKLRRQRQEQTAEEDLAQRLQQLAGKQQSVAGSLASMMQKQEGQTGGTGQPDPEASQEGATGKSQEDSPEMPEGSRDEGQETRAGEGSKEDESEEPPKEGAGSGASRQEIEEQQLDIAMEAVELQKLMQSMDAVTDLARERMDAAAEKTDAASGALTRGNTGEAAEEAQEAAEMLRGLSRHVQGLLAEEPARQIAMSRDLAAELAAREDDLAEAMQKPAAGDGRESSQPMKGSGGSERKPRADEARALAEMGRTLEDLLKDVARSDNPRDRAVMNGAEDVLTQEKVPDTVQRMQSQADEIGQQTPQAARTEARDLSDRLEVVASRLDELHRMIVAPRLEELRNLEQQAVEQEQQLDTRQTETEVTEWQQGAGRLIEELEQADVARGATEELKEAMAQEQQGTGPPAMQRNRAWTKGGRGYFTAPKSYKKAMRRLITDLQEEIQLLALGDLLESGDEPIPPQYEHLVERYHRVLSSEPRGE